jgi:transcription antitermination factor NusG
MAVWVVAFVAAARENHFAVWLGARGIETYTPLTLRRTKLRHCLGLVERPQVVFPNYSFISVDAFALAQSWELIAQAPGFRYLIANEYGPIAVSEKVIDELHEMQLAGKFDYPPEPAVIRFNIGQPVKIIAGVFSGLRGLVIHETQGLVPHLVIEANGMRIKLPVDYFEKLADGSASDELLGDPFRAPVGNERRAAASPGRR